MVVLIQLLFNVGDGSVNPIKFEQSLLLDRCCKTDPRALEREGWNSFLSLKALPPATPTMGIVYLSSE